MESTLESVNKAEEMVDQLAKQAGFDEDARGGITMAVREAMINAVLHGNAYDPGKRVNLSLGTQQPGVDYYHRGRRQGT